MSIISATVVLLLVMALILWKLTDVWIVLIYLCPCLLWHCFYFSSYCLPIFSQCCCHQNSSMYPTLLGFLLMWPDLVPVIVPHARLYVIFLCSLVFLAPITYFRCSSHAGNGIVTGIHFETITWSLLYSISSLVRCLYSYNFVNSSIRSLNPSASYEEPFLLTSFLR